MFTSYEGISDYNLWPIGRIHRLDKVGWFSVLAMISEFGSPVLAIFVIKWWAPFLIFPISSIIAFILTMLFKKYTQILTIILLLISYIFIIIFIIGDL